MEEPRGSDGAAARLPPGLRAVLFDLDGTLLEIDGEGFLDAYVDAMTAWWRPEAPEAFRHAVMAASVPIFAPHPGQTNGAVFRRHLGRHLGLDADEVATALRHFHEERLPGLHLAARPVPEAPACVRRCLAAGLRVAVATTPIYLPEVIQLRLRWAGLTGMPWALITHSENMHTCKPDPAYFAETAARLGLQPEQCLMVGDDPLQDGPCCETGMAALLRGRGWCGLADVAAALMAR